MSNIAIDIQNIGKTFIIGQKTNNTLRESLVSLFKSSESKVENFRALNNVSLSVKKGEAIGIIGRNGAGKSTLLKILSQITSPTEGRVEINGRVSSLLEVGTGFHPELTGRENIYLNGTILGMSRKEVQSKFDDIVKFSGIEKFLDTPVKRYSSGMHVRLAFAVAAHLDPEILIIDEVLAVGDHEFQQKCLGKMKDVTSEGRTVLFVSHNMGVIQSLCDRAVYLKNGEVQYIGKTDETISKYMNSGQEIIINNRIEEKPVFLKNIWLSNTEKPSKAKNEFNFDEDIQLNGEIISTENFNRSVQICFAILDRNGNRVSSIIDDVFDLKQNESRNFKLSLPNSILAPNIYSFLAEIYTPPGLQKFDYLENILPLEILDNGTPLSGYDDHGIVLLNYKWKWK